MASTPTSGDDFLLGTDGPNNIDGLEGHDEILGLGGADTLIGGSGNDSIDGGDGDDTLIGGAGNDSLVGGAGNDALELSSGDLVAGEVMGGGDGVDTIRIATNGFHDLQPVNISSIERLEFLTGSSSVDLNATQLGTAFSNALHVDGAGFNVIRVHMSSPGTVSAASWTFGDWTSGIGIVFHGSFNGNDTITGSSQADNIQGLGGVDVLVGLGGNDVFGFSSHSLIPPAVPAGTVIDGGQGSDTLQTWGSKDFSNATITSVETLELLNFGVGNVISFTGDQLGSSGISTIIGSGDANNLGDVERLQVSGPVVDLSSVSFINWSNGVESIAISGTGDDDALTGSSQADNIQGLGGVDVLVGLGGNDVFGFSSHSLIPPAVPAGTVIDGGQGSDTLQTWGSKDFSNATITSVETLELLNFGVGNVISFTGDQLGSSGISTIIGSGDANNLGDVERLQVSGPVVDLSSVSFINWSNGVESIAISGTGDDDALTGSSQADNIQGLGGVDVLVGLGGNDVFGFSSHSLIPPAVPAGTVIDGGQGSDTLQTWGSKDFSNATITSVETLELLNFGVGNVISFTGDQLGSSGISTIIGSGDANNLGDVERLQVSGPVVDLSSVSFINWSNGVESIAISGTGDDDALTGSSQADLIFGDAGNDIIDGGADADTAVFSGNRANYLISQNANGTLTIADTRSGSPDGTDTISDVEFIQFADGTFAAVDLLNDAPTGGVTITGTVEEDQILSADTSSLTDADGLGSLHYQWQRDSGSGFTNVGSDQASYTLGDADVGALIQVVVSYTDAQGTPETVTSAATAAVANVNDTPTGGVTITGTVEEDQILSADTSSLTDADGLGSLHYQWQRDSGSGFTNVGSDQASYTLGDADVGALIQVVVSYTDAQGTPETVTSAATAAVANVNDTPTGGVTITGTVEEDQILSADTSSLTDADGLGSLHYQWQRDSGSGFTNVGSDQASYTLGDADVGALIQVVVSYTDAQGTPETVTSAATAAVANVNDTPTGGVLISDATPTEGQMLSASPGSIVDPDGTTTSVFSYQWQAFNGTVWTSIAGATGATFTPGQTQVGQMLRVVASYTDDLGMLETLASAATGMVGDLVTGNTFANVLTGTAAEDLLSGLGGNDTVNGLAGNDLLNGGFGNDRLDGGAGDDAMSGGADHDTYVVDSLGDTVIEVAGEGTDKIETTLNSFSLADASNVENLTFIGVGNFVGTGNTLANTITGNVGNDRFVATIGDGNDAYVGGNGFDTLDLSATTAGANVTGSSATSGQIGSDVLSGIENVIGSQGADTITGTGSANEMDGGPGNDTINAGGGVDRVIGGAGNDTMDGGGASDTFVFAPGFGNDTINAFDATPSKSGQDFLDISAFGITTGDFAARVTITDIGADTLITIDGSAGQTITLLGIGNATAVSSTDFILS